MHWKRTLIVLIGFAFVVSLPLAMSVMARTDGLATGAAVVQSTDAPSSQEVAAPSCAAGEERIGEECVPSFCSVSCPGGQCSMSCDEGFWAKCVCRPGGIPMCGCIAC